MKPSLFSLLVLISALASFDVFANVYERFDVKQLVIREALRADVPVPLALAVAKVESDFNARALSSAGARGVMQIMPQTAKGEFGVHADDLWDAQTNVRLGMRFLKQLHRQYGGDWELALSHYNGGTVKGAYPHGYTKKYIAMVQKWQRVYQEQANLWGSNEPQGKEDFYEDEDDLELVELREWRAGFDREPQYEEPRYETPIIIVERRGPPRPYDDFGGRRPPPPPPPFGQRPRFH